MIGKQQKHNVEEESHTISGVTYRTARSITTIQSKSTSMEDNMEALKQLASTFIGKVLIGAIIILLGVLIALGFHDLSVSGERNVSNQIIKTLEQKVKTAEAETKQQKDRVSFMKAWMERDKLDAIAKDAEFNRTMAAKPAFRTKIEYVPTGNNCIDLNAIIDEARGNKNTGGTLQ